METTAYQFWWVNGHTSTKQLIILDLDEKQKTKQQNGKQQMCHFPPCEGYMHVVWYQTAVIDSQPLTEVSHTVSHGPAWLGMCVKGCE